MLFFLTKQRWPPELLFLRQPLVLSVAYLRLVWFLGPACPAQFWKPLGSSLTGLVQQLRNFQVGDVNVAVLQTLHLPSPSSILSIETVVRKMQHILKKELQFLSTNYFLFSPTKSMNGFLVKKFSLSKLKSAADMCFPKVLSIQNLSGLQQK